MLFLHWIAFLEREIPFDSLAKLSYLHTKAKDEDSKLWLVGHVAHMVENNTFFTTKELSDRAMTGNTAWQQGLL